jgi:mono/diheme cytochrome c family protein
MFVDSSKTAPQASKQDLQEWLWFIGVQRWEDCDVKLLMMAACVGLTLGAAIAREMSYGEAEYLNSCAVCHGVGGRGDGPLGGLLLKHPTDLTHLSRRNGGRFPYSRVSAIIDGRYAKPSHGDHEMPVWGRQSLEEDAKTCGPSGGEVVTTERIQCEHGSDADNLPERLSRRLSSGRLNGART